MMMTNSVTLPSNRFTLSDGFRTCVNGKLYIGNINTDATVSANQLPVFYLDNTGTEQGLVQPIQLDAIGRPTDGNGNFVEIYVKNHYSITVVDIYNVKQLTIPSLFITEVSTLAELRSVEPFYPGQRIYVTAHDNDWKEKGTQLPVGGGYFVYHPEFSTVNENDDDGIAVITTGNKHTWVREDFYLNDEGKIHTSWYGAISDFTVDSTAVLNKTLAAAAGWINKKRNRVTVVFHEAVRITSTININTAFVSVDLNTAIVLVDNTGSYSAHPMLTDHTVALNFVATNFSGPMFLPAYYSNTLVKNGSLVYGSLSSDGGFSRNSLGDSKVIGAAFYSATSTIYGVIGTVDNVSFSCFGVGWANGAFGWGMTFNDCKFEQNYEVLHLVAGTDSGEKITVVNGVAFNNGSIGTLGDWPGDFQWDGGSWDYMGKGGFNLGTANAGSIRGALVYIRLGRIEYNPTLTGPLIDGSGTGRACVLEGPLVNFAAPADSTAANDVWFKSAFDNQFTVRDMRVEDASASGTLTQNYKFGNNYKITTENIQSFTLSDYFITPALLNAAHVKDWVLGKDSDYLTVVADPVKNTVTITSSQSGSTGKKNAFIFIPLRYIRPFNQIMAMATVTSVQDVASAFYFGVGYKDQGSSTTETPFSGGAYTVIQGTQNPTTTYGSGQYNNSIVGDVSKRYDGLVLTVNCFNLQDTSTPIVIDTTKTGLITI